MLAKTGVVRRPTAKRTRPRALTTAAYPRVGGKIDLRRWCPETRYQGLLTNTCASFVVAGLLEYFEKRAYGVSVSASRRFLHCVAKNFQQAAGADPNQGVYIRQVFGVLRLIGAPPEKYFPYPAIDGKGSVDAAAFREEPSAFCYALAQDYRAIRYYRLDPRDKAGKLTIPAKELLDRVRAHLAAGIPTSLGLPLHERVIQQSVKTSCLPYPSKNDKQVGMHAVMIVGYDDRKKLTNSDDGVSHTGALLLQNSWGADWGEKGFGWLSYEYLLRGRTSDFWTLLSAEWIDTNAFQLAVHT